MNKLITTTNKNGDHYMMSFTWTGGLKKTGDVVMGKQICIDDVIDRLLATDDKDKVLVELKKFAEWILTMNSLDIEGGK